LLWGGILYTLLITFPTGIVIGIIAAFMGEVEQMKVYGNLIGLILGIPIGIWVVRIVLNKQFSEFRIVLVPSNRAILNRVAEQAEQYPARTET